ncbi:hypothetical protein ACFVH6_41770 [Spirillospora sp. NPDC127200]
MPEGQRAHPGAARVPHRALAIDRQQHGQWHPRLRDRSLAEAIAENLAAPHLLESYDELYADQRDSPDRLVSDAQREQASIALRAFLQRAEVRLSTLNRVAGSFLAAAGILLLGPILLRDAMPNLMWVVVRAAGTLGRPGPRGCGTAARTSGDMRKPADHQPSRCHHPPVTDFTWPQTASP